MGSDGWSRGGVLLVGVVWLLVFGDGYPVEDLIGRLPGQPNVGFKQYGGYVDVDDKAGRSLFYYFVEAEQNAHNLPLTLWLNGGPGCSSVGGGAFTELGPFFPKGDGRGLRRNSKSWNKASNLLFVESPAGVGRSYSNTTTDYTCGDDSTAKDMLTFMLKCYKKFPNFKSRHLFLTGESYAGHYIPQLANVLLDYNKQSKGFKFNIKGVAIGNPLLRLDKDTAATYEFFWSHGMLSDEIGLTIMNECHFDDYVFPSPHNVTNSCNQAIDEAYGIVGDYINVYDVILDVCYPSIVEQELRLHKVVTKMSVGVDVCMTMERHFYFNLPEVQKALHANRTSLPYSWSMCSDLLNYNEDDGNTNVLPLLKRIIEHHIPVWIFSGDQDSVVPLLGSRTLVRELAKDLNFKITVPYGAWFHKGQGRVNLRSPDHNFWLMETDDYGSNNGLPPVVQKRIFFGREVGAADRKLLPTYQLKSRTYLGPTAMDAEVAFLMANQAQAKPGKLVYDPFVGTGSILIAAAHFGAMTMGADIDIRVVRDGRGPDCNVWSNFKQYGLEMPISLLRADNNLPPWRSGLKEVFDAIICDPPYGVRAGGRKSGGRKLLKGVVGPYTVPDDKRIDHIPSTAAYSLAECVHDLLDLAAKMLVQGGRLVYFYPVLRENDSTDTNFPQHPCFKLVAACEQILSFRYSRVLLTMVKIGPYIEEIAESARIKHLEFKENHLKWMEEGNLHSAVFSPVDLQLGDTKSSKESKPKYRGKYV